MPNKVFYLAIITVFILLVIWMLYAKSTTKISYIEGLWESSDEFNEESGIDSLILYIAADPLSESHESSDKPKYAASMNIVTDGTIAAESDFMIESVPSNLKMQTTWTTTISMDSNELDWPETVNITVDIIDSSMTIWEPAEKGAEPTVLAHLYKNQNY